MRLMENEMIEIDQHHIQIGSNEYYIYHDRTAPFPSVPDAFTRNFKDAYIPATSIKWTELAFDEHDLLNTCKAYETQDDVWCPEFKHAILLIRPNRVVSHIKIRNTTCIFDPSRQVPNGPLVIEKKTGRIFLVSKVLLDTHRAFACAIVPHHNRASQFQGFARRDSVKVRVPSRLYYVKTRSKPLAGLRVGVKDSIALKGLRTGFGSEAWYETYEPEESNAPCIQRLLDAGVVIVGKLICSEFCEGVEPSEWVQGICPYNPRGDGQQKPSSSSTGSAVAAAAYEWLDVTIGTDTGGSIRHPAGVNGLFGQRPSTGIIDLSGVLGAPDLFNTVGVFARSVDLFVKVGSLIAGIDMDASPKLPPSPKRKYNLLYPVRKFPSEPGGLEKHLRWFPHPDADQSKWTEAELHVDKLVSQIEAEFDCQRTYFNLYDFWTSTAPKGQAKCLDKATGQIYGDITTSAACATVIDKFIDQYATMHEGNLPVMGSVVKARLEYGRQLSEDQIAAAIEATAAFKKWIETTFFALDDENTTTIMIFPQSRGIPDYRDDESRWNGNLFIESFSIYAFGYLCGCPDYTIPVGEIPFRSRVTNQSEYLPVSFSLVGKSGADRELFDIVTRLYNAGIVTNVAAGRRMYPVDSPG